MIIVYALYLTHHLTSFLFIHDISWELISVLLLATVVHMQHNSLSWPLDAACYQTTSLSFSELIPDGRNETASAMEPVAMLLHSVEVPLFLPTYLCLTIFSSFSDIKIGKGERGSSLGDIGLQRIVSTHSEAILSSEKYNEPVL